MIEDKAREVKRSKLWHKIYAVVSQIPKKEISNDAMDYSSASTELEQLMSNFHKERVEAITDEMAHNEEYERMNYEGSSDFSFMGGYEWYRQQLLK